MNNTDKENEWNEEYRNFMVDFYPKSGPVVSTWQIYLQACRARQSEIDKLKAELESIKEVHARSLIKMGISLAEAQDKHDLVLKELEKAREELKFRPSKMEHENLDQYAKSKCIELEKCQSELEKARELIEEILGIDNKNKPVIEALKDARGWEVKAKEFLKREGE